MKILLFQLDGKLPNLALMRVAAYHLQRGDEVELRGPGEMERRLWDSGEEFVYASLIFEKTRPLVEILTRSWPSALVGGTGWNVETKLEDFGIEPGPVDYSLYPDFAASIGFSQRGCRLRCPFCVVPRKEGRVSEAGTIHEIWRGEPYPKHIILLDNDFFGQPAWRERLDEMVDGRFRVNFNQGINVRFITEETAAAVASVDYRGGKDFKRRVLYTAWDNRKDERRVLAGLELLAKYGVKPYHVTVYMLIGYWPREKVDDWLYRAARLREFGALPYPMPFVRNPETVGFQRWVVGGYDRRGIEWADWVRAKYQPKNLGTKEPKPCHRPEP